MYAAVQTAGQIYRRLMRMGDMSLPNLARRYCAPETALKRGKSAPQQRHMQINAITPLKTTERCRFRQTLINEITDASNRKQVSKD
jgi:hypothetical protein